MKKQLQLFFLTLLFASGISSAQIKYWDFGGKDLGPGYDNMMPEEYLNAISAKLRQLDWVDDSDVIQTAYADGTKYKAKAGFELENGESVASIYFNTLNAVYAPGAYSNFQIGSGKNDGNGGIYMSGASLYTKPTLLPDLDGTTNMGFMKDSNSDRILTVSTSLTRYDDYTELPDGADPTAFPGCIQFTTPGEKRWNREGGRGFSMTLQAGEYLTVVGSGQYTDIEGDGSLGFSTGTFQFANFGGTGAVVDITDAGTGTGSPTGPIDGPDQGDQSMRVMEFQAIDAGPYILRNRGGKIRIYRMYVSSTSIKSTVEAELNAALGLDDVSSVFNTEVKAAGNRIYISNVKTATEVNIYSITGALVKTVNTNTDLDFAFKTGLWIATVKTEEGKKSVKLLVK